MNIPKLITELSGRQIAYLKATSNYTLIYTQKGRKLVSGYSLNVFQELFAEMPYIRINRSYLVHKSTIESVDFSTKRASIRLTNKQELYVPRRKRKRVEEQLALVMLA